MPYHEAEKGKCRTCGFLAKHATVDSHGPRPSYYEVGLDERESGKTWSYKPDLKAGPLSTEPACFRLVADLRTEAQELIQSLGWDGAAKEVVNKPRGCEHWYPYLVGFSPKEHMEELKLQKLEQERRDFEFKLFNMSHELQRNNQKIANRFTLAMLVLTLVQVWLAMGKSRALVEQWAWELFTFLLEKLR